MPTVNPADIVYTPDWVVNRILSYVRPEGRILDPCSGEGAFYSRIPKCEWCEIRKGKDFFKYNEKVDYVIGNPPYSIFEEFLRHSFAIAMNVSYIVPCHKVFQRKKIMNMVNDYGGIKHMWVLGGGRQQTGFNFGFPCANFLFSKGYKGPTTVVLGADQGGAA